MTGLILFVGLGLVCFLLFCIGESLDRIAKALEKHDPHA
jgi:hypothetical protein